MALTKEDLQAIAALMETEREYTSRMMDSKLEPIKDDIADVKSSLVEIKEQIKDIDDSIGAIADWADNVSIITKVPFAGGSASIK